MLTLQACSGGGGSPSEIELPENRPPFFTEIADRTVDEGTRLVIEIAAADADGKSLTLDAVSLPDFITVERSSNDGWRLTTEPEFDDSGEYSITLRVSDEAGETDEVSFTLTVVDVNRAPTLTSPGDLIVDEGQSRNIALNASDPDGDALSFSGNNLPAFIAMIDNGDGTARLDVEPGYFANGTYNLTVRVTDSGEMADEVEFVVTVTNVNRAPLLTPMAPIVLAEGAVLAIPLAAIDPDGDGIMLDVAGAPTFAGVIDNGDGTGTLTLTPGYLDSGIYQLSISAIDSGALFDESGITVTVSDVNRDPILSIVDRIDMPENEAIVVPITASDPDGDDVALSMTGAGSFISLTDHADGTGTLTLQPGFMDSGAYTLRIRATDSHSAFYESSVSLEVTNVNRLPLIAPVPDAILDEGETLLIDLSASDPDDDTLTLTGFGLPDFIRLVDNGDGTGSLDVQPSFEAGGSYTVSVTVTDTLSGEDETSFVIMVTHVNRPPAFSAITDPTVAEGTERALPVNASDPDGDSVTLEAAGLPTFVVLNDFGDGTGTLSITPTHSDSGTYPIVVRARDTDALFDELTVTITVADINRDPVLGAIGQIEVSENETLIVPISASDPDADGLALSMTGAPAFSTLTDNGDGSGVLTLAPGYFDSGAYSLSIRATDTNSAFVESLVSIDVTNVNRRPLITPVPDVALAEGETQLIALNASDSDDDNLSFSGLNLPDFVSLIDNGDGSGSLNIQPDFADSGIYSATVRVTDAPGAEDEADFFITVGDVNRAPLLSDISDLTVAEGSTQTIPVSASDPDTDVMTFAAESLPAFVSLADFGDGSAELRIDPKLFDSGTYTVIVRVADSGFPMLSDEQAVQITINLEGANHVARENALPGTADWHLDNPALLREIEGYASATSVNRGDPISLYVNTNAPAYALEVFRTGWYQGLGARRLLGPIDIAGTSQITPAPDPITGLVEANWINPYEIQTSDSILGNPWPTGVYLARLTESAGGRQSYIVFVVREDGYQHDVLFQLPVTTYQAYNAWGGKSVYDWNSGPIEPWGSTAGTRASHISFDRPYARNPYDPAGYGMGAGEYLTNVQPVGRIDGAGWDYNMVRWLEHEQYDVSYITNIDTHRSPGTLLNTEVFLSHGHDEYWTWEMRDNVEAARDSGIDLAFFASNTAYYQTRLEPSPTTTTPDRVMVVYKDELLDPVFNDANPLNDFLTTIPFRFLPIPRPEEALIGVQYVLDPYDGDIIVTNPAHWVFDKTGFVVGSLLEGLLGYEPDGIFDIDVVSNREVLAETPIVSSVDPGITGTSHMTIYSAPVASVFATGSMQWSWGLDDYNVPDMRTSRISAMAQQITGNVLENFGALPYTGEDVVAAACVRVVSSSDATDDQTMAAAEFDMLDENGLTIPKAGWNIFFADSEETGGADLRAIYAIDDDPATFWQTEWAGLGHPHEIQIDLGGSFDISALRYVPRQDSVLDGTVGGYEIYTSPDCASWSPAASGTWIGGNGRKIARFNLPD